MKTKLLSLVAALAAFVPAIAQNASEGNAVEDAKAVVPESAQMLATAGQLVKYGYSQENALPLIQAVEIYQNIAGEGTRAGNKTAIPSTEAVEAGEAATKRSVIEHDVENLLATATVFADGDETLLTLIEGLKQSATRGATKNYDVHHDRVDAKGTDVYTIRFWGGELACVVVSGDGDTDLDLYVYDENDNLITSDTDGSDQCVVSWTPKWTGTFTIKIKNRGKVFNRYSMAVN